MKLFEFGEVVNGYDTKVINERIARAGAGILFSAGLIIFMTSLLTHDFILAKTFITFFMFDFFMRVVVNPKFSLSLILGYFFVRYQQPEYVGAEQKRFAWSIGLVLSILMFIIVVIMEVMTPIKIAICVTCLILLFAESAFGICLGCKLYHVFNKKTKYCVGGCEIYNSPKVSIAQWMIVLLTILFIVFGYIYFNDSRRHLFSNAEQNKSLSDTIKNNEHCDMNESNDSSQTNDDMMNHNM